MRLLGAIFLSLLAHLSLSLLVQLAEPPPVVQTSRETMEIELVAASEPHNQQLVRFAPAPEPLRENNQDPARFLSQERQRVAEEQRAVGSGMTQNVLESEGPEAPEEESPPERETPPEVVAERARPKPARDPRRDPLADFKPELRPLIPPEARQNSQRPRFSTVGEALPEDLRIGSFTALNTDRYLFYSFFARVEELVRQRWERRVRRSFSQAAQDRTLGNNRRWITEIEVQLKPSGELIGIAVLKESGFQGFDLAATESFQEVHFFPHPPSEMVDEDGLIRLQYSFHVFFDPHSSRHRRMARD